MELSPPSVDRWWADTCRSKYLHLDGDELPTAATLYYDPILDVHHEVPITLGMIPAIYLAPQVPDEAHRLFQAGITQAGMWEPTGPVGAPGPRMSGMNLWLAREFGLRPLADVLSAAADEHCQPTWDTTRGEFTWGFQLDEPHPRGQYNGTMAAAQVATEGAWWRLANVGPGDRFDEPTVIGVDFPAVALREARWDPDTATLTVTPIGIEMDGLARTSFRVTNVGDPTRWTADGTLAHEVLLRAAGPELEVEIPVRGEAVLLRGPESRP